MSSRTRGGAYLVGCERLKQEYRNELIDRYRILKPIGKYVILLKAGAVNPNTNKELTRDTWITVNSTSRNTFNKDILDIVYISESALFNGGEFASCTSLKQFNVPKGYAPVVISWAPQFFYNCKSLEYANLSDWDTTTLTVNNGTNQMFGGCTTLRFIELGENFFRTPLPINFGAAFNLGLNDDNTSNGWLEHLASIAPVIEDGQNRILQLPVVLKGKSWTQPYIQILQDKGYTIS